MYNDLSILDTITWRWVKKDIPGLQPTARINANVEVYDDKLVIINGIAAVIWFTDVSVLKGLPMKGESIDSSNLRWFTNNPAYDNGSYGASKLSEGAIAGIILAVVVVLVIILIVLYKRMRRFRRFLLYIQNEIIWNPRSGEPFWAESSRLIVRFILLFLFSAFFVYTVIRTVNSAIVIQEIRSKTTTVDVPDIRLCLSGYIQEDISQIDCRLMNGTSCNGDVTYLTFNDDNRPQYPTREQFPVSCALYRPPPGFKFINDDKDYSYYTATQITFSIRAPLVNQSIPGIVQMDIYAPNKDPNEVVHGMKTLDQTDLTEADIRQFNISDTTTETYYTTSYLQRGDYATAHYILTQEETLIREDGWNNIGFSNHYDTTTNLAYELSQTPDPLSDPDDYFVGQVRVMPKDFIKRTNREQKVFSLLNGIAQAGGVLGLFIALQTILFGFRPQSPWGIVHRWSFGNLRVKLTERLTTYFNRTEADVPLVNPVSKRFSMVGRPDKYRNEQIDLSHMEDEESMNDKTRIKRMEERLQLMELLLKSYYLNDEVFRSLDVAIKSKKKGGQINRAMNVNNSPLMKSAAEQDSVNNAYLDSEDDTASSNYLTKEKPDLNRNPSSTVFNTNPPHRGNYQPNLSPHIAFDPKE
ncbi:hypothetical protein BDB01DRAFT_329954 [Pilobolus umbonatus]|nr:hypothetical protein BDB01DRAFT_329954 [Pilobolus umbonatus]